jgi:cell division protein YceG involved in septum cleavage
MEATVNPDKNEFFYFVADPKVNGHIFSRALSSTFKKYKKNKRI